MSVEELKKEIVGLSTREQAEVSAFLFHLRHASEFDYQAAIQRRLEDKDPSHWLTPDEFERRLGQN
ncbi:MAG: hypothetical protein HY360_05145 [Verrucomicrobia bacterium]|nr:hypothetical protein [Verrucomicrobiota bacterium]